MPLWLSTISAMIYPFIYWIGERERGLAQNRRGETIFALPRPQDCFDQLCTINNEWNIKKIHDNISSEVFVLVDL